MLAPSPLALKPVPNAHIHNCVNLSNSLVISGKLVDLNPIADQLAHDLDLELVELTLGNSVSLGNDGNNVHLSGSVERGSRLVLPDCGQPCPGPIPGQKGRRPER